MGKRDRSGAGPINAGDLARITKPGIAAGVTLAGAAGMALSARGFPSARVFLACTASILAAACGSAILNVIMEEDTDSLMPRVSGRVLALRRVGRGNAAAISAALILLSVAVSLIFLNIKSALLIFAAAAGYVLVYTLFLKKSTPFGTLLGAVPGALPVLIGYCAVRNGIGMDGVILFLVMLLWQPPHFLAHALKYSGEYAAAGIPVMPVVLGEGYTKTLLFIYLLSLPPLTLSLWVFGYLSPYFAAAAAATGFLMLALSYGWVVRDREFGRAFIVSLFYIAAILAAVIIDNGMSSSRFDSGAISAKLNIKKDAVLLISPFQSVSPHEMHGNPQHGKHSGK